MFLRFHQNLRLDVLINFVLIKKKVYIGNKAVGRRKVIIAFDKMVSTTC